MVNVTAQKAKKPTNMPPEWSKKAIWYQIFVERFNNGDSTNDPRPENIRTASDFNKVPADWSVTPWTSNWYKQEEWAKKTGGTLDQTLQLRRYGGDLQGVINKLDYLSDLGINAIYLNPINDAPSLHKYDARNYHHVDVNFGPDPVGDTKIIASENPANPKTWKWTSADTLFLHLVKEAHKRNIRVIVDYSWNHTGVEFWAWKDVLKNQQKSAYKDWYDIISFDDPSTDKNEFSYNGWLNLSSLPELKKVNITGKRVNGLPYEGDINEGAKKHIFDVSSRWLAPNGDKSKGIDGFRLDVADQIGLKFWRDYRAFVKSIKPDAYLVGEIWWERFPEKFMDPTPYTKGDIFDGVMFYQLYRPAKYFFSKSNFSITASQFKDSLEFEWARLSKPFRYSMMNVATTHDTPRLFTCFDNPGKYKFQAKPQEDTTYKTGKPTGETSRRVYLYLMHQFTNIGAPSIWNGEEMGMWGSDDPDCRKPLWWDTMKFEPESRFDAEGKALYTNPVLSNLTTFRLYKSLIRIRKENPVLSLGDIQFLDTQGKSFSYLRFDKDNSIMVLLNADLQPYTFHFPEGTYQNLLTNKKNTGTELEIRPLTGVILKKIK
jgi:cyclomaltodextrinase / maltogenic alpha-amylase / neopullulanase